MIRQMATVNRTSREHIPLRRAARALTMRMSRAYEADMTKQHYTGSCQCGSVAYEVEADLDQTFICNCSRCQRIGAVLTFVPKTDFHLTQDGPVTEYLFNKQVVHHRFCPTCGIESYALGKGPDGVEMVAVNVNCLAGIDPRALDSKRVNGASA